MRILRIALLVFGLALFATPIWAVDYRVDSSFPSLFAASDEVTDVYVYPDGKILVGGSRYIGGGAYTPYLARLNPNGTTDSTFSAGISPGTGSQGEITSIQPLANGQFLITGIFSYGGSGVYRARINSDGSVDTTLPADNFGSHVRAVQPDGKLIACGTRVVNSVTYNIAYRLNANGTFDPTFRITFADNGGCGATVKALPDGKILLGGTFLNGGQPLKPLYRLNSDGSQDMSFDAALAVGSFGGPFIELADGKILIDNGSVVRRLLPDGGLDLAITSCSGNSFLPLQDGSFFMKDCRKWPTGHVFEFARVFADGTVDPTFDEISFTSGLFGFRSDGNGNYYAYGDFGIVNNESKLCLVRLVPNLVPSKAKFDFDGDGKSDISVFRPSNGVWYLNQSTAGFFSWAWGFPTDKPSADDVDRDGKTDITLFRDGNWHAYSPGFGHRWMCLGAAGDKPIVDNLNDGYLYQNYFLVRGIRSGDPKWFLKSIYTNCWINSQQPSPITVPGEVASDKPIIGDFNGDSRNDIGYFRDGLWFTIDLSNYQAPKSYQWGLAGDIPLPGDYDGDRQTDYAIFRPSTGTWWINRSTDGVIGVQFGQNGDVPVPADYDGDGKVDIAVFRDGIWYQLRSATGAFYAEQWGLPGDIPIPAQNQ